AVCVVRPGRQVARPPWRPPIDRTPRARTRRRHDEAARTLVGSDRDGGSRPARARSTPSHGDLAMRIGELAGRLDFSTDTVRFYERAGWLPSASRAENGYRDYREEGVAQLRLLIGLRLIGLPRAAA